MRTVFLSEIMKRWASLLAADSAIASFCLEKYGKQPTVYLGFNEKKPPKGTDCPVIIIFPGSKEEGLEEDVFTYRLSIGWSIVNESVDTTAMPGVVEYVGVEESDTLGQLIWAAIAEASPNNPISRMQYDLEAIAWFPQIPGRMDLEIDIVVPIGGQIEY